MWGKEATAFATWLLASPKPNNHCTVGCKFCLMLRPRILGKAATAFAIWFFINPKSSNHCTAGCSFCSTLQWSTVGSVAINLEICARVRPKSSSHRSFGFRNSSMLGPRNHVPNFITSMSTALNPSTLRKLATSRLLFLPNLAAASFANSLPLAERLHDSCSPPWSRFTMEGRTTSFSPVSIWINAPFKAPESEPTFLWLQVSTLTRRTFPFSDFLLVWLMRTTYDPFGAYSNRAAFFFLSMAMPSFSWCLQNPSYSTNSAASFSLRIPNAAKSGSKACPPQPSGDGKLRNSSPMSELGIKMTANCDNNSASATLSTLPRAQPFCHHLGGST